MLAGPGLTERLWKKREQQGAVFRVDRRAKDRNKMLTNHLQTAASICNVCKG